MKLSRFEAANHARIADFGVDVRGHAVIVGANDVGKTSILRLLNLLLGTTAAQLYQQLSVVDLRDGSQSMRVEAVFNAFTDEERTLFPREISINQVDKSESLRVQLLVEPDPDNDENVVIRRWFPESGHDRAPTRPQQEAFGWRYLSATRGASANALDGPNSALQALLQSLDLGTDKTSLTNLIDKFNEELEGNAQITDLRIQVAEHLSKSMPRRIEEEDLSIRSVADAESSPLEGVSMYFERDGGHVPITEQSDGLRQLMSMTLFDLAEGAANIVAIDEPEIHLHPSSQRTVAELFGTATNQKILATHSPYIVQRFEPAQIIAVSPEGVCHQLPDEKLSEVEKLRANWWSSRLLETLTARVAVLVEGVSDRIILERAARLLGVDLDRMGAVVFELDGATKFPHVYKLLGPHGFNVKTLGLVDELEAPQWTGAIGGKPKKVLGISIFVSKTDLEDEYSAALGGPATAIALTTGGVCQDRSLLQSCEVADLDDIEPEAIAKYCREHKVEAAVAVGAALDEETAKKIESVSALVERLRELGTAQ